MNLKQTRAIKKTILSQRRRGETSNAPVVESWAKAANEMMGAILKFLIAGGAFLTFIYCFFFINFFPTGLTAGDTVFFLAIVVGFTFLHIFLLAFAWFATGWWVRIPHIRNKAAGVVALIKNKNFEIKRLFEAGSWKNILKTILNSIDFTFQTLATSICLFFLIYFAATGYFNEAMTIAASGFLLGIATDYPEKSKVPIHRRKYIRAACVVVAFILPFMMAHKVIDKEIKAVFNNLGIRKTQNSLVLSEENFNLLRTVAEQQHIPLFPCDDEGDKRERIVSGIDILWHGIGERSLVAISIPAASGSNVSTDSSKTEDSAIRLELKREGMYVVHATNGLQQRCIDLNEDALFESGNATLLPGSKEKIEGKIKQMLNGKLKVHKVRVIGHADIQQFSHSRQTNYGLALLRAESIKNLIEGTLHTANGQVVAESKGASEPKVQCSEKLPSPMMRECLSPNRRVEIRAEFTSSQN